MSHACMILFRMRYSSVYNAHIEQPSEPLYISQAVAVACRLRCYWLSTQFSLSLVPSAQWLAIRLPDIIVSVCVCECGIFVSYWRCTYVFTPYAFGILAVKYTAFFIPYEDAEWSCVWMCAFLLSSSSSLYFFTSSFACFAYMLLFGRISCARILHFSFWLEEL